MDRQALIQVMFKKVSEQLYVTLEQFVKCLDGYDLSPEYNSDGEMHSVVIHAKQDFHFMCLGPKWSLNKDILSRWPGKLIEKFGYATTATPLEDTRQHRFNKRLGFFETSRDAINVNYKIEKMTC
jgi:hypothetical protein